LNNAAFSVGGVVRINEVAGRTVFIVIAGVEPRVSERLQCFQCDWSKHSTTIEHRVVIVVLLE
jgi:hypothetical protein